ncbi:MAG TPA: DUF3368 domain-containing protein [Pyrinomonadaceae bacterium]|nr:DUF3368 domain-containing protein [Pyrinomonadaceae bacterium]
MKEPVVVDSTCLIGLDRIRRLDILTALFDPITVPPEVALVSALKLLLDDGEAEAVALANVRGDRIILDDRQARSVAAKLGLRVIGTVGVLLRAKRSGIISAIKPMLDDLELNGFHLSSELKKEALRLAGE